jgi:hypothetical protein
MLTIQWLTQGADSICFDLPIFPVYYLLEPWKVMQTPKDTSADSSRSFLSPRNTSRDALRQLRVIVTVRLTHASFLPKSIYCSLL